VQQQQQRQQQQQQRAEAMRPGSAPDGGRNQTAVGSAGQSPSQATAWGTGGWNEEQRHGAPAQPRAAPSVQKASWEPILAGANRSAVQARAAAAAGRPQTAGPSAPARPAALLQAAQGGTGAVAASPSGARHWPSFLAQPMAEASNAAAVGAAVSAVASFSPLKGQAGTRGASGVAAAYGQPGAKPGARPQSAAVDTRGHSAVSASVVGNRLAREAAAQQRR
jgi:hypothetical protein